ncbi:hypothetical protein Fcan01_11712 [Folsomia candida]|uniref:Uncharacterized protein n=1 Tax=Folsomia candida TaxID=158441 RepID=A0A226EB80_FOLCA|nr:hypothetical protein Fcan01_11712 [Folsomia candida]
MGSSTCHPNFATFLPLFSLLQGATSSDSRTGCILYLRVGQDVESMALEDDRILKFSHPSSAHYSLVIFNRALHVVPLLPVTSLPLISRHNGNLGVSLLSRSLLEEDGNRPDLDKEIVFGGYVPSLRHLIVRPEFIFVLIIRSNRVPRMSCWYGCLTFPFSVYLVLIESDGSNPFNHFEIEDIPIRHYYSRQLQKFEPIREEFAFRQLYKTPLLPTDTDHIGIQVTFMSPGSRNDLLCHLYGHRGIRGYYESQDYSSRIPICHSHLEEIVELAINLNFSLRRVPDMSGITLQFILTEDPPHGLANRYMWKDEVQAFIKYCRPYTRRLTSLKVWLTPFQTPVWVGLLLAFFVISLTTEDLSTAVATSNSTTDKIWSHVTVWLSSSYFLFFLLTREPIRNFTRGHVTFVILTLLLSWGYEGCFTTSLMTPSKPFRYKNVGEFINSSQIVIIHSANLNIAQTIDEKSPVFSTELERHGVAGKTRSFLIVRNTKIISDQYLTRWENLSSLGYLDTNVRNMVPVYMERLQMHMDSWKVKGEHETYICDQFPFSHVNTVYTYFKFVLARKAIMLHNAYLQSGILMFQDSINSNAFRIHSAEIARWGKPDKIGEGGDGFILLKHLRSLFYLNLAILSGLVIIFMLEIRDMIRYTGVLFWYKLMTMRAKLKRKLREDGRCEIAYLCHVKILSCNVTPDLLRRVFYERPPEW